MRCSGGFLLIFIFLAGGTVEAGDRESHLTASHFLSRFVGYSASDASRLSRGNWSMDVNSTINAMPGPLQDPWHNPFLWPANSYTDRGKDYHSFGSSLTDASANKIEIRDNLIKLRSDLVNSKVSEKDKLVQLGQYLHATQDVYFHQDAQGNPFSKFVGHAAHEHETDYVDSHYDQALRANAVTYDILEEYKNSGTLPDVPSVDQIFLSDTNAAVAKIAFDPKYSPVVAVTDAINGSYDTITVPNPSSSTVMAWAQPALYQPGLPDETVIHRIDPNRLNVSLQQTWNTLSPSRSKEYQPLLDLDDGDNRRIDYDGSDRGLLLRTSGKSLPSPGGISLSQAAAESLALDIDIDGIYADQNRVVLSGRSAYKIKSDAGLFLTAMRLACSQTDPYFSLDPDDGQLWQYEGNQASRDLWKLIEKDMGLDQKQWLKNIPNGLAFRSFSAKRDYGKAWATISKRYPHFKTRLVFQPLWLKATRFGEIMFKGDLLLKELSSGSPTVVPSDKKTRAAKVDGFISARMRSASEMLLANVETNQTNGQSFNGNRFWFDLVPNAKARSRSLLDPDPLVKAPLEPVTAAGLHLKSELISRGIREAARQQDLVRKISLVNGAVDLSNVYPKMFIVGHDLAANRDVEFDDPYEQAVARDVNVHMPQYIAAYDELRELTEVFRLYVAAVSIVKQNAKTCSMVVGVPIMFSEKSRTHLPEYYPSELHVTVASLKLAKADGAKTSWWSNSIAYSGGVSPSGLQLHATADHVPTVITNTIADDVKVVHDGLAWQSKSKRRYLALKAEVPEPEIRAMQQLATFKPITKQMVEARLGAHIEAGTKSNLRATRSFQPGKSGGMLDNIDPESKGTIVVPYFGTQP